MRRKAAHQPKDEKMAAWRGGLFSVAKKHLCNKKLLPLIQNVVHLLRSLPTALLFHSVATLLFSTLLAQEPREEKVVDSWTDSSGNADYIWEAPWWAGPEGLQPGVLAPPQTQEIFGQPAHKYPSADQPAAGVRVTHTLSQLRPKDGTLPDVATEPFPDKWVLESSQALTREGRTDAAQFCTCKAFTTHSDAETQFWCMPRTLATYDPRSAAWSRAPDDSVKKKPCLHSAAFSKVLAAREQSELDKALRELCGAENDIQAGLRVLASNVLVALGPQARARWRRASTQDAADQTYMDVLCNLCNEFCMRGTCEHVHVALLDANIVSLTLAKMPSRSGGAAAPTSDMPHVDFILPACGAAEAPPRKAAAKQNPAVLHACQALRPILKAADALSYAPLLAREQMMPADIARLDIATRAIFPTLPAAVLLRVQRESQNVR
ncbi:mak16-a, partial [Symbiodinium pilosum]